MKDKIKQITDTKQFHIGMIILIILIILGTVGLISLKYSVEGEKNLPFNISKISVISSIEGTDNQDEQNRWNLTVDQNNDIYMYIKKNDNYEETEIIDSIKLENFNIIQTAKVGEIKLYKPQADVEGAMFKNAQENQVEQIEYVGDLESNIKESKISNQGGLVVFRYAITNIGNYISNDDVEINHNELLKKININNENLKFKVNFDIIINLKSGKKYKANYELDFPVEDVVNNGLQSKEYTNLDNIIFKRVSN